MTTDINLIRAPGSFDHKKFFDLNGLKNKSKVVFKKVYEILDTDSSGILEKEELHFMVRVFSEKGRILSDKEVSDILKAGDKDGDGKLSMDEFMNLVNKS
ncbi:parvalbumin alpha-like [Hyperolius riggenbachi]|uniref:parvalbumin alpha-like n=1 Tax=Hyperolius riggenbachi TaxID=752182 RepID=UPI0035A31F90